MNFKIIITTLILTLNLCSKKTNNEPDKVGYKVFNMLKNIKTKNNDSYFNSFITHKQIIKLGNNKKLVTKESTRKEMISTTKESWLKRANYNFNGIKEKGNRCGIDWQKIKYIDFFYCIKNSHGFKECKGHVHFQYQGIKYNVLVVSIFDGKKYQIVTVRSLKETD